MKHSKLALLLSVLVLTLIMQGCGSGGGDSCSDGIVGNLNEKPSISITGANSKISGIANNIDTSKVRVVGWALTDAYYVQPLQGDPFTSICGDGSWEFNTHPWRKIVVLLVDETYNVPQGRNISYHPAGDPGVLAYAEG